MQEPKKANAVIMHAKDNVATAVHDLKKGDTAIIKQEDSWLECEIAEDISFGHKFAIKPVEQSKAIIKYGESIGLAKKTIQIGEHVHIHNVDSVRGKGK